MKRTIIAASVVLLSLVLIIHSGWAAEAAPRDKVVFYQDGRCTGSDLELGVGSYADLREYRTGGYGGQDWNDQISCLTIGSGITKVIIYEHVNFEGRSMELARTWANPGGSWSLSDGWWNDKISSIKIVGSGSSSPWGEPVDRDTAVFYQDYGCDGGNSLELEEGEYADLREFRVGGSGSATWNDRISCITAGSRITRVIVYEHINFGGRSKEFTRTLGGSEPRWNLSDGWWNDKVSSIKIVGSGSSSPWDEPADRDKAVFYQDGGCEGGRYLELEEGEYSDLRVYKTSGGQNWNDRISCITVGSDITRVIVYEHINFGGRSKEFARPSGKRGASWSLTGEWANDKISSIEVIGSEWSPPFKTPPRDKAVFYQDNNCRGGNNLELKKGEYPDLREFRVGKSGNSTWDDRISCIALGSDITRVIVYEHPNFGGKSKEFTRSWGSEGSWNLSGEWSNDEISSLKVYGPGSWLPWSQPAPRNRAVFYQDDCGSSKSLVLRKGEYPDLREFRLSGSGSSTWDDRISCIAIGSGITRVIVYEHPNFEGKSKEFTRSWGSDGGWSLSGEWANDEITSLKVQ